MSSGKKVLAVDYGSKRIGLAVSDEKGRAMPFGAIEAATAIDKIKLVCGKEEISIIVLGLPKSMSGEEGKQAEKVRGFGTQLQEAVDIPIEYIDERLTSKVAVQSVGRDRDIEAARLILESYLHSK